MTTSEDRLPWSHYAPELRDELLTLAERWHAATVADAAAALALRLDDPVRAAGLEVAQLEHRALDAARLNAELDAAQRIARARRGRR